MLAGSAGLSLQFPISIAIAFLLCVVALSYAQTIRAYPSGGGSYVVARENLGTIPGRVLGFYPFAGRYGHPLVQIA